MSECKILRRGIGSEYFVEYLEDGRAWFGVVGQVEMVPVIYKENVGLYPREGVYEYEFDKILLMITPGDRTVYLEDGGLNLYEGDGPAYPYGPVEEIDLAIEPAFNHYEIHVEDALSADGQSDTGVKNIWLAAPVWGNKAILDKNVPAEKIVDAISDIRKNIFTPEYIESVDGTIFQFLIGID